MPINQPAYVNERELAARLGLSPITLRKWRFEGRGPAFSRFGAAIRYPEAEITTWLAESTHRFPNPREA